jgi:hypothetical protein
MDINRVVIAVDPGKITGTCILGMPIDMEPIMLASNEFEVYELAPFLRSQFEERLPNETVKMDIVCERFTINAQTVRNSQAPWSLEQIGILKQTMRDFGVVEDSIIWQTPADAMNMFNNDKLKRLGYWHRGGAGHANDAIRHALLRAVKTGWKPLALLG